MSQVEPEWAERQAEQRNASPDRALGTPHLRSMLSTAELLDGLRVLPITLPRTEP